MKDLLHLAHDGEWQCGYGRYILSTWVRCRQSRLVQQWQLPVQQDQGQVMAFLKKGLKWNKHQQQQKHCRWHPQFPNPPHFLQSATTTISHRASLQQLIGFKLRTSESFRLLPLALLSWSPAGSTSTFSSCML